jgi:hypothetical protein
MKELLDFVKDDEFDIYFAWIGKNILGVALADNKAIVLNPIVMIVSVFIHEFYHLKYPSYSEADIEGITHRKLIKLTKEQILELFNQLVIYGKFSDK